MPKPDPDDQAILDLGTKFKDELGAVINKYEYAELSAYTVLGAVEVLKSELMEYLFDHGESEEGDDKEDWRRSLKLK